MEISPKHQESSRQPKDTGTADSHTGRPPTPPVNMGPPGIDGTRPPSQDDTSKPDFTQWPLPSPHMNGNTAYIYDTVRSTMAHNHAKAKIHIETSLDLAKWASEATGHKDDNMVLQGLRYGFPIQYTGPPIIGNRRTPNHDTALRFPDDISSYIKKEMSFGALEGPFKEPPFTPWFATSPLMTREKVDSDERRVIVDLSFPDGVINEHIQPHMFNGDEATHNLPTVEAAVRSITAMCPGDISMAVIDLSRAYRQFPVSPMDWPLLGIVHENNMYFDKRIPFGSRMSSYIMQSIAQYIVRALNERNIVAHMYLDDVIMLAPTMDAARKKYDDTIHLLRDLGLQVATQKLQPPSHRVKWLGINIDVPQNQLSIPEGKIAQISRCMAAASGRKHLSRRHLQRIIGLANHLAKIVRAARVFICRILAAFRAADSDTIPVGPLIKADLIWFKTYLANYNGRAIIPNHRVVKRIWADACTKGVGASDGSECYMHTFAEDVAQNHHINELEAINCVAAVRTFVTAQHAGGTVEVHCDNQSTVDALTSGRAKNQVLAACARAMWYQAACTDTDLTFTHVPGEEMSLPDALSRAESDHRHEERARAFIRDIPLRVINVEASAFNYSILYDYSTMGQRAGRGSSV